MPNNRLPPPGFFSLKPRIFCLDLLRIAAIAAVVLLHAINPILITPNDLHTRSWYAALILNEFARCGVPLFFMISGALLLSEEKNADLASFYRKRLPRLLLPLIVWHTVYYFYYNTGDFNIRGYFSALLANGSAYHMWFVYSLLGIYFITPFLRRITAACTDGQLAVLLLILLFPGTLRPLWNMATGFYIFLFDPLMECYLAYFLAGYLLSRIRITPRVLVFAAIAGAAGFALGFFGNLAAGDAYPFNGGYMLNHHLLSGALFLLTRAMEEHRAIPPRIAACMAALSDLTFGVYWVHVLALDAAMRLIQPAAPRILLCLAHFAFTLTASLLAAGLLHCIRPLRRFLM